jgi:hypothetical protein
LASSHCGIPGPGSPDATPPTPSATARPNPRARRIGADRCPIAADHQPRGPDFAAETGIDTAELIGIARAMARGIDTAVAKGIDSEMEKGIERERERP